VMAPLSSLAKTAAGMAGAGPVTALCTSQASIYGFVPLHDDLWVTWPHMPKAQPQRLQVKTYTSLFKAPAYSHITTQHIPGRLAAEAASWHGSAGCPATPPSNSCARPMDKP
jgi:hypothetical protein